MNNEKKMTKTEVALMLKEALKTFCEETEYSDALARPFRQDDCLFASDGHILIRIRPKEAGVALGKFPSMDEMDVQKVIPVVDFNDLLHARTVFRKDVVKTIAKMRLLEKNRHEVISADVLGVQLSKWALAAIEQAMRICGAEKARLAWHKDRMVMLQLANGKHQETVSILHIGWDPINAHVITLPVHYYNGDGDVSIDWQKGLAAWQDIKAEQERIAEEERMARRSIWMVEWVKRAYIPVYAKDAAEAKRLCDENWFEPDDDGEWELGDYVPEEEDLDDLDRCYRHVITRDGIVERDEIYKLEQVAEKWHEAHHNNE